MPNSAPCMNASAHAATITNIALFISTRTRRHRFPPLSHVRAGARSKVPVEQVRAHHIYRRRPGVSRLQPPNGDRLQRQGTPALRRLSTLPSSKSHPLRRSATALAQDVAKSFVGLRVFGGHRATPENVAMVLNTAGRVCVSDGDEDDAENRRAQIYSCDPCGCGGSQQRVGSPVSAVPSAPPGPSHARLSCDFICSRLAMEHLKRILEKVSSKNNGRGTGDDDSSEDESSDFDD